ncbi:MAG TPA: hypothetical protein VFM54_22880 [Micromonosporaceae bacterium]|nr:hypothetical protein [Micromonosporaceae bacterium]
MGSALLLVFWGVMAVAGVALVASLIAEVAGGTRRDQDRRERIQQWAVENSWAYTPSPQVGWGSRLPGRNRDGVSWVLSGTVQDYPVSIADYTYTEVIGDTIGGVAAAMYPRHLLVVVVRLGEPCPAVAVEPLAGMAAIGRALFGDRGEAVGDERFDQRFRIVTKADRSHARQLVGPALVAEHVAGTVPAWSLKDGELLAYREEELDDPEQIPTLAAPLTRVAGMLGR